MKTTKRRPRTHGFTLVELMIVLVILGIISIGAITAITGQSKVYHSEEDLVDMQMNAKIAMDRICFLLRMAGVGCSDSFGNNLTSGSLKTYESDIIYGVDEDELKEMFVIKNNAVGTPDQLTLVGAVRHVGNIEPPAGIPLTIPPIPSAPGIPSSNQIKVRLGNLKPELGADARSYIFISPYDDNKLRTISTVSSTDTFATINLSTILGVEEQKEMESNLAIGTILSVYQIQAHTIRLVDTQVTNQPTLRSLRIDDNIDASGTDLDVADNIQDLQFQYGLDTDDDSQIDSWVDDTTDIDQIRAIRVFIMARTGKFDREYIDRKTYTYPDGTTESFEGNDNFTDLNTSEHVHRYVLENTITIRNRNF
ncbi:PilW family protein [bacterium]|nr:PilW family protein [bacterium]